MTALAAIRLAQGYHAPDAFLAFLSGASASDGLSGLSLLTVALVFLGGLAMNLTPCVLPLVPVNLLIIGRTPSRGLWYGLGQCLATGALGLLAALGGLAFGTIQASPWFNLGVAVVFAALALALSGVFQIDLSGNREALLRRKDVLWPGLFAFLAGALNAILAGACVAPVLISVLVLTSRLYAAGDLRALALPFVLGLGLAAPWPFLAAGLRVLPKPGAWMKLVNRILAAAVLLLACWYGRLAWLGFHPLPLVAAVPGETAAATPEDFPAVLASVRARRPGRPVLVDCWASWCKNCAAMEGVFAEPRVAEALKGFEMIRLRAEDMRALRKLPDFAGVQGLPAFLIFY